MARFDQIIENHRNKSTGNLAFLTNVMNFGGNLARTFTIFTEASDDLLLLASNIIPAMTNGYIFLQFLMYWNNTINQQKGVNEDAKNKDAKKVQ
jgi:mannose-P-dolichol utilization defect protein 1